MFSTKGIMIEIYGKNIIPWKLEFSIDKALGDFMKFLAKIK